MMATRHESKESSASSHSEKDKAVDEQVAVAASGALASAGPNEILQSQTMPDGSQITTRKFVEDKEVDGAKVHVEEFSQTYQSGNQGGVAPAPMMMDPMFMSGMTAPSLLPTSILPGHSIIHRDAFGNPLPLGGTSIMHHGIHTSPLAPGHFMTPGGLLSSTTPLISTGASLGGPLITTTTGPVVTTTTGPVVTKVHKSHHSSHRVTGGGTAMSPGSGLLSGIVDSVKDVFSPSSSTKTHHHGGHGTVTTTYTTGVPCVPTVQSHFGTPMTTTTTTQRQVMMPGSVVIPGHTSVVHGGMVHGGSTVTRTHQSTSSYSSSSSSSTGGSILPKLL